MASRYWVGGTASWDGTAGSKWALTSGGAGGQAVPTSSDDVFFDASSGANTVTIASGNTGAKSITCTGFTGTLAGSSAISVSGSVLFVAGMTVTYTGTLSIIASGTLTTASKTLSALTINGSGITVVVSGNLIVSGTLTLTLGTLDCATNNPAVNVGLFSSQGTNVRTLSMGSGLWTITGTGWTVGSSANLTLNKNTADIKFTSVATVNFGHGDKIYNNVWFAGPPLVNFTLSGGTFNDLKVNPGTEIEFSIGSSLTTSTLTVDGTTSNPVFFHTNSSGTQMTISVATGTVTLSHLATFDMAFTGGATFVANHSFNVGNTSGITINPTPNHKFDGLQPIEMGIAA